MPKSTKIAKSAKRTVKSEAAAAPAKHVPLKAILPSDVPAKLARRRLRAAVAAGKISFHGARERWLIPAAQKAAVLSIVSA